MFRLFCLLMLVATSVSMVAVAESPAPAQKAPAPAPSPSTTPSDVIDSLAPADLQTALSQIKNSFPNSDAVSETELNRATLEGLLIRQPNRLMILSDREAAAPDVPVYSEILEGHIGYLRPGSLTATNLKTVDRKLTEFAAKKVDQAIIDLRASSQPPGDFATAAEFAKRFCPKGKTLFVLRKDATHQDHSFESDREPSFKGLIVALTDADTAGGAEAVAAAVRSDDHGLIIGQPSSGRAAEFTDSALSGGKVLRIASSEVIGPDGQSLFPNGVKPDLPVQMPLADKRQIFQMSSEKGMSPFIYEPDRPHLNEAALLAGTNPELDIPDAQRRAGGKSRQPARDPVLQRALDVLTSLEIYQKR